MIDAADVTVADVHADCVAKMTDQQETISNLWGRIDTLNSEQIEGSDHRLSNFWAKAQELATEANHCDVFDQMAEALGGPRRLKGYTITLAISGYINIDVEAVDAEDAMEQASEAYRNGYVDNNFGDLDGVDEDWYNAEVERND